MMGFAPGPRYIACTRCSKAKTKCDRKVPCSRCVAKKIPCEPRPARRFNSTHASEARHLVPVETANTSEGRSYSYHDDNHESKRQCISVSAEDWDPFQTPTPVTESQSSQYWAHTAADSSLETSLSAPYDTSCHEYMPTNPLSLDDSLKTFDARTGRQPSFSAMEAKTNNDGINNDVDAENSRNECPVFDDSLRHVGLDMVNNTDLVNPEGPSAYDPYWTSSYNQIPPFSLANLDPALHPSAPYSITPVADHTSINFEQENNSFSGGEYHPDPY